MSEEFSTIIQILRDEQDKVRKRLHEFINEAATQHSAIEAKIIRLEDRVELRPPCDLHVTSMKELNDSVTRIEIINAATQGKVDGFILSVNRLLEKFEADVYKKDGLMTTTQNNKNQIGLMWGIIVAVFIAGSVMFIWKH